MERHGNRFAPVENITEMEEWKSWRKGELVRSTVELSIWGDKVVQGVRTLDYAGTPIPGVHNPVQHGDFAIYMGELCREKRKLPSGRITVDIYHVFLAAGSRFVVNPQWFTSVENFEKR